MDDNIQRIISKHQHSDGLIGLWPQNQMLGKVSYDFGPNQGHGTHSLWTNNRYRMGQSSIGHYMNATGYGSKAHSYTDILTAALIANFNPDAGAAFVFCKTDAAWDEGANRYALALMDEGGFEIFMRKGTVEGQLYYRHDMGDGRSLSMNVDGMTTTGWFCMAMMWDRLVNDEVRIFLDGAYVERGTVLGTEGGADLLNATIGAANNEDHGWLGGIGITALYNEIKTDDEMLKLSTP